ncbi:MAG TPA: ABC transporter permease [Planctomycetes bacterium]|nr:ABC transporter permease [Planctomycetota bacterium]
MRPYLAILADSFRQAFISKALWAMLALISLLLILCACFGYRERISTKFSRSDINDVQAIAYRMINSDTASVVHMRELLDEDTKEQLSEIAEPTEDDDSGFFRQLKQITGALNELVESKKLFVAEVWTEVPATGELHDLVAKDAKTLSDVDRQRRNRLFIERTFREHIQYRPQQRVAVTFATMEITPDTAPLTKELLDQLIRTFVIPTVLSLVVGFGGILFAIAITSPIIPRMYDQGALHLLLSKPVSRSIVFVTKFFGGCAFILLYIAFLISGMFMILGVRFGIWNTGLLWCIPVFVFSFSIFYSISALAGAIWKNAIVAVTMTAVFWLVCFVMGVTHAAMKSISDQRSVVRLASNGEDFWGIRDNGQIAVWDRDDESWLSVGGGRPLVWLGPVTDEENNRIVVASANRPSGFFSFKPRYELFESSDSGGWNREEIASLPKGTLGLYRHPSGKLIVVTNTGVLAVEDVEKSKDDEESESEGEGEGEGESEGEGEGDEDKPKMTFPFLGFFKSGDDDPLRPLGPKDRLGLSPPVQVAVSPSGDVHLVDGTQLVTLSLDSEQGQFVVKRTTDFSLPRDSEESQSSEDDSDRTPTFIQATDDHLLMGNADGELFLYSADDVELLKQFAPLRWNDEPRFVYSSPQTEHFYVLTYAQALQVVDAKAQTLSEPRWPNQGDITAFQILPKGKGVIVSIGDRITILDVSTGKIEREHVPEMPTWMWFFHRIVSPVYYVFPQPSDLSQTVQYLASDETTVGTPAADIMGTARVTLNPWDPVRANLIFLFVILVLSCVYFERQEL